MSPPLVGVVGLLGLLLLMILGMPIAIAFIVTGFVGLLYLGSPAGAIHVIVRTPYVTASFFPFVAIPLFILMGNLCFYSKVSDDLFNFLHRLMGQFRGGLGMATVAACGAFGTVSGSSLATAAAMGKVSYPEMRRYNYHPRLAAGCIAAGGELGTLIPPSIGFIVYGILVEASISKLFMAGILPGVLLIVIYCGTIWGLVKINPALAPPGPSFSWKEKISALPGFAPTAVLAIIVLVGIYGGVFTPTEAAAVGVVCAFIFMLIRKRLTKESIIASLLDTGSTTAMLFFIMMGATIFTTFMTVSGLPKEVSKLLLGLGWPPYGTLALILLLYLPMGMFIDATSMMLLTIPIFLPALKALDLNLIWVGVLVVRLMEIGLITPPLAMNCFVVAGIAKDTTLNEIYRGIGPFVLADVISVAILMGWPQITLWLPGMMN